MTQKIAESWLDAFRQKDISHLQLADTFTHTSPFGVVEGKQTYLDLVKANQEAFFNNTITQIDIIGGDGKFAIRYLVNDDMEACDCIYIENGQIQAIYAYYHLGPKPTF